MILPWLIFIAVDLITYTAFVKLAARLLRYTVSWKSSFLFAVIVLVVVVFDHVLAFDRPVAIRIGTRINVLPTPLVASDCKGDNSVSITRIPPDKQTTTRNALLNPLRPAPVAVNSIRRASDS
jgi:hypothetical protein